MRRKVFERKRAEVDRPLKRRRTIRKRNRLASDIKRVNELLPLSNVRWVLCDV